MIIIWYMLYGGFQQWGFPDKWRIYEGNISLKWMIESLVDVIITMWVAISLGELNCSTQHGPYGGFLKSGYPPSSSISNDGIFYEISHPVSRGYSHGHGNLYILWLVDMLIHFKLIVCLKIVSRNKWSGTSSLTHNSTVHRIVSNSSWCQTSGIRFTARFLLILMVKMSQQLWLQ